MSVNVNRNVADTFYRYKMPRLAAKVEGKGNGIKTVIVNMVEIGKALDRPAAYPCKFFGLELGAQTQIDLKNDKYIVNGSHDATRLQDLLDVFIRKFVLCQECENPETELICQMKKGIFAKCSACGHFGLIVDTKHKLNTYIFKNPPDVDDNGGVTPSRKDRRVKKNKKEVKTLKTKENGDNSPPKLLDSPDPEPSSDLQGNGDFGNCEQDAEWSVDTSKEAVAARMNSLTDGVKGITTCDTDFELTRSEKVTKLRNLIQGLKESGELVTADKELALEAEKLDIKPKAILLLAEAVFTESLLSDIDVYQKHFIRLCYESKASQKNLLVAIEVVVAKEYPEKLMSVFPRILMSLYDKNIVEEGTFIDWSVKKSDKSVGSKLANELHERATKFIDWLSEAEEDEESDQDDGIEEVSLDEITNTSTRSAPINEEDDQDLNIDDI